MNEGVENLAVLLDLGTHARYAIVFKDFFMILKQIFLINGSKNELDITYTVKILEKTVQLLDALIENVYITII